MVRKVIILVSVFGITFFGMMGRGVCGEGSRDLRRTAVVEIYERTRAAVVNISGVRLVSTSGWHRWVTRKFILCKDLSAEGFSGPRFVEQMSRRVGRSAQSEMRILKDERG